MEGKKSRIENTTEDMVIDRISHLPDSILGHLLSFLPTENAAATSILSKRWKSTWLSVPNLDFSYFDICYANRLVDRQRTKDKNMKFIEFVERVLLLHDGGSINKFRLSWSAFNIQSHAIAWINFAIKKNVQTLYLSIDSDYMFHIPISGLSSYSLRSLELCEINLVCDAIDSVCLPKLESLKLDHVFCGSIEACDKLITGCLVLQDLDLDIYPTEDSSQDEELGMSSNVFSCDSLHSFKLNSYLYVPTATVVRCARLEILKLCYVRFETKEACEKLISGCPKLQYLELRISGTYNGDDDDDMFTCIISSASLRHLEIDFWKKSILKLNACSLESFEVRGDIYEIYVEKNLHSLVKADFRSTLVEHESVSNSYNSIVEAVRAFDCAKVLTLSPSVMSALSHATVSISTEFKRLVKLVIEAFCSSLQDVIQNSNNLEDLTISQQQSCRHDHPRWTTPVEVPRCLSNSLKSVCFYGYNGSEGEREMIRYILKHGSALKVMHISCHYSNGDAQKLKLVREICVFPRKSTVCEVHFSE